MALLIGYGAGAINPYLAFEIDRGPDRRRTLGLGGIDPHDGAQATTSRRAGKGVLKVMSKMGISTVASYTGAQIFEAIGLGAGARRRVLHRHRQRASAASASTRSPDEVAARHALAHATAAEERAHRDLELGGEYQWRREGEYHLFNPDTVFKLQHATRGQALRHLQGVHAARRRPVQQLATLRGLFEFTRRRAPAGPDRRGRAGQRRSCKRFSTGAMSYGSISAEAHETLAIAMNRIGGKSNTGEGGEDAERFLPRPERRPAPVRRSSRSRPGRFGVTTEYLVNADDLQIKMAQGAKPGEGGQLPGHKVYPWIAKTRHSTPGVGLI